MAPDRIDVSADEDHKNAIALKYLELARSEILERVKIGYQTLIVYSGGIGAITGWVLQRGEVDDNKMIFGAVVPFLALIASWILYQNENIVNALARYQLRDLSSYFHRVLPEPDMWEKSTALRETDHKTRIGLSVAVEMCLILGPAFVYIVVLLARLVNISIEQPRPSIWGWLLLWLVSAGLTAFAVNLWLLKYRARRQLRDDQESLRSRGVIGDALH